MTTHVHATRKLSVFSSSMHTLDKAERHSVDEQSRKFLGLIPRPAQALTFNSWSPDPWTIVAGDGTKLVTISNISLTIVRPHPPQKILYLLSTDVKSEGWTETAPNEPDIEGPLRLDFLSSQGGIVWSVTPMISVQCGTDETQRNGGSIVVDIFDLISSVHLSIPTTVNFWRC
jgi:hypothetical protein